MEENVNFDNEVLAYLTIRKDQLIESHKQYIQGHPEIREVLNDFLSAVLLHKPVSPLTRCYFSHSPAVECIVG
jgi:hypothetical protein